MPDIQHLHAKQEENLSNGIRFPKTTLGASGIDPVECTPGEKRSMPLCACCLLDIVCATTLSELAKFLIGQQIRPKINVQGEVFNKT
jgi:hypothetical protein